MQLQIIWQIFEHYYKKYVRRYGVVPCTQRVPSRVGNTCLVKRFLIDCRRDGEAETQLLISSPNIPLINPKSLLSTYEGKAYKLLKANRPLDVHVKPDSPDGAFREKVR